MLTEGELKIKESSHKAASDRTRVAGSAVSFMLFSIFPKRSAAKKNKKPPRIKKKRHTEPSSSISKV